MCSHAKVWHHLELTLAKVDPPISARRAPRRARRQPERSRVHPARATRVAQLIAAQLERGSVWLHSILPNGYTAYDIICDLIRRYFLFRLFLLRFDRGRQYPIHHTFLNDATRIISSPNDLHQIEPDSFMWVVGFRGLPPRSAPRCCFQCIRRQRLRQPFVLLRREVES